MFSFQPVIPDETRLEKSRLSAVYQIDQPEAYNTLHCGSGVKMPEKAHGCKISKS